MAVFRYSCGKCDGIRLMDCTGRNALVRGGPFIQGKDWVKNDAWQVRPFRG
ncbi:hypothetical protein YSA_03132 [Pseudomonas putida ND6]|uniref:Uncharacterized protein n=1 Tax=Pseudomonas putida ND6 TaxID=231023 RepID=I3USJ3_PSEPU|nr:hypothetical protein YSA_03132 [Pseudomonas putida ND6]